MTKIYEIVDENGNVNTHVAQQLGLDLKELMFCVNKQLVSTEWLLSRAEEIQLGETTGATVTSELATIAEDWREHRGSRRRRAAIEPKGPVGRLCAVESAMRKARGPFSPFASLMATRAELRDERDRLVASPVSELLAQRALVHLDEDLALAA